MIAGISGDSGNFCRWFLKIHSSNIIGFVFLITWDSLMKQYMCIICGFVYDEEQGWPDDGIQPGTKWEDIPEDWVCPECAAAKSDFEMIEV